MGDRLDALLERRRRAIGDEAPPEPDFADVERRLLAQESQSLNDRDPELDAIVRRVKARIDVELLGARPVASAPPRRSRRFSSERGVMWSAAALVMLGVGLGVWLAADSATRGRNEFLGTEAAAVDATPAVPSSFGEASSPQPLVVRGEPSDSGPVENSAPFTEEAVEEGVDGDEVEESEEEAAPRATSQKKAAAKSTRAKRAERRDSTRARQERLFEQAETAWRGGDPRTAEKRLLELTGLGRSKTADLAWGDLFTLARQLRGSASEYERWGEYLRQYPRGLHADDARAGRCRLGPLGRPQECWSAYLEDFPKGAHRAEARLAVDTSTEGAK